MVAVGDAWFRFEDHRVSVSVDPDGDIYASDIEVCLRKLFVQRCTPKGVWLADAALCQPRFVLGSAHRRWACPTLELALESYAARKKKQARIYQRRADDAHRALRKAQALFGLMQKEKQA